MYERVNLFFLLVLLCFSLAENQQKNERVWVFCISGGRTGTKYLQRVFDSCEKTRAFHEPQPLFLRNGIQALDGDKIYYNVRKRRKIEQLKRFETTSKENYVETNHLFISNYADVIMNEWAPTHNVKVLLLFRNLPHLVYSRVRNTPRFNCVKRFWIYCPSDRKLKSFEKKITLNRSLSDIEKYTEFYLDIYRLAEYLQEQYHLEVIPIYFKDYITGNISKLLQDLGLRPSFETAAISSQTFDTHMNIKKKIKSMLDFAAVERQVLAYIEEAKANGVSLPNCIDKLLHE